MSFTLTGLASLADTTALSTYTTGSFTPSSNVPVFAWVVNTHGTSAAAPTSVTGNGLTWSQIATRANAAGTLRGSLYWALGASPSAGGLSAAFSGNQTGAAIHVFELAGADTSGTIVQSASNVAAAAGSVTVTLSAFGNVNNAAVACFAGLRQTGINPDTGFSEIYDNGYATPATEAESGWKSGEDTSIVGTWSAGTADILGVACEVKLAAAANYTLKKMLQY